MGGAGTRVPAKALNGFGNRRRRERPRVSRPAVVINGSWIDEASPALCCENVTGGHRGGAAGVRAGFAVPRRAQSPETARVTPSVWGGRGGQRWLWVKLSETLLYCRICLGLLNPVMVPVFSRPCCLGEAEVSPLTVSSELRHQNFREKKSLFLVFPPFPPSSVVSFFLFSFFFVGCFDPKWFGGGLQAGTKRCRLKSQL